MSERLSADDVAAQLAEIRARLEHHTQAGRYTWDIFTGSDVEFLLALIDGDGCAE